MEIDIARYLAMSVAEKEKYICELKKKHGDAVASNWHNVYGYGISTKRYRALGRWI